jgi:hypothetical protein
VNGRVGEYLLHAVARRTERVSDRVYRSAVRGILRFPQAYGFEYLPDLAGCERLAVAEFRAERLGAVAAALSRRAFLARVVWVAVQFAFFIVLSPYWPMQ